MTKVIVYANNQISFKTHCAQHCCICQNRPSEKIVHTVWSSTSCTICKWWQTNCCLCSRSYLEAYGDDGATDLLPHHELLSQHGQDDVLPESTGQTFTQADDPLPPAAVGLILKPRGAARVRQTGERRNRCETDRGERRCLLFTSHMGLIPSLKRWKSLCPLRSPGRTRWL